jgi:hypothetical protein
MGAFKRAAVTTLVCFLVVQVVGWSPRAWAQVGVTTASLAGDVVDKTNSAVAGAKVTVKNRATGQTNQVLTDGQGHFTVLQLLPGSYSVTAEQPGFQKAVVEPVRLNIGANPDLKITLNVGQVSETVEVSAEEATVQTTQAEVSNVIQTQQLEDLPLNQRSFTALVTQQPGLVQITSTAAPSVLSAATNTGSYISADGSMGSSVAYLMDGVNFSNGSQTAPGTAAAGDIPGVEAIQEFKVLSHNYNAEYGGSSAAVVTFATKTGTNKFHGNLYEYLRNDILDSRSYFDYGATGAPYKPGFKRNQFGGTLGGPIIKNRTFFFVNYEGLRQSLNQTTIAFVPNANAKSGIINGAALPDCASNPAPCFSAAVIDPLLALYPNPTPGLDASLGLDPAQGVSAAAFVNKQPTRQDFGVVNINHTLTSKDQLQVRYQIVDASATQAFNLPSFQFNRFDRDQNTLVKWARTINSNLVNTFSVSLLRQVIKSSTNPLVTLTAAQYTGNPTRQTIGVITVGNGSAGTSGGSLSLLGNDDASPFALAKNVLPFNDDLFWVHGKHTISIGGMVERMQWNWLSATIPGGSYTFPTLSDLLEANPSVVLIHRDGPPSHFNVRTTPIAWYVNDSWRATSRLTLNFGIRHDFQIPVLTDAHNQLGNWQSPYATSVHVGDPYNNYSLTQFQPRLGVAYDPWGDGKTVIRAGYGIFNDFVDYSSLAQGQLQWNSPQPVLNTFFGYPLAPGFLPIIPFPQCTTCTLPGPFPGLVTGVLEPMNSPTTQQWNFGIETELPAKLDLQLTYTGSQSWHLPRKLEANYNQPCGGDANPLLDSNGLPVFPILNPASGTALNCGPGSLNPNVPLPNPLTGAPGFTQAGVGFSLYSKRYDTNAFYNGLTVQLSRTVGALSFQTSYTWAKNISESDAYNSNNILTGVVQASLYPANIRLDRSESAFSRRHRFTESLSYELPFGRGRKYMNTGGIADAVLGGWRISSLGSAQTGQPFSVLLGADPSGIGDAIDFPDRPNQLRANPFVGRVNEWFDPAAFTSPAPGHIGTASRTPLVGPKFVQFDASVAKIFQVREGVNLQFRADVFNLLNHSNFGLPNSNLSSPQVGVISTTTGVPREVQFSLKMNF